MYIKDCSMSCHAMPCHSSFYQLHALPCRALGIIQRSVSCHVIPSHFPSVPCHTVSFSNVAYSVPYSAMS